MSSTPLLGQRQRRHSIDGFTSPRAELLTASETDLGRDMSPLRSPSDLTQSGQSRPASVDNTPSGKKRRISWTTVKSHLGRSGPIHIPDSWKNSSSDSISKRSSSFKITSQTESGTESFSEEEMESIDSLLAQLVAETQEKGFVDNFLWTSTYFIEPVALLERLIDLYHKPAGETDVASEMVTRFRLINTIKKMLEMQCITSNDASVTWHNRLLAFVDQLNKGSESDQSCAAHLKQKLDEIGKNTKNVANDEIKKAPSLLGELNPGKADAVAYVTSEKFNVMQDSAIDIAEQLTLRDYEMFQAIPIELFQKKRFEKGMEDPTTPLGLFIAKFNEISLWIATQIVSASNSNGNKELIARFIEIMRELRKLNNFNAVMAFYSALNLGSVSGFVTRCFAALPEDLAQFFNQIKKVMDHSMNFKYYRETLEMAEPPCIPYLGLIMRDLMHLEELPSTEDNMVNWHKLSRVGKTLAQIAKFHKSPYQFAAIPHIQKFLRNIPKYSVILSENQLYTLSRAIINDEADASEALSKIDAPKLIPTTSDTNLHEAYSNSDLLPDRNALFSVPPWVIKREVRDEDGNRITFEEVIGEHTVICVFMRQFAAPPKSASSLSQIKPFLDELGVKLIAIGSGNTNSAAGFKIQSGFDGELFFDESLHLIEDFKVKRGWNKVQGRRNLNRSKIASLLGCDENEGLGDVNQLGGAFLLRGEQILFEHLEQFAGDNVDPIQLLRKAGASQELIDRIGLDTPKLNANVDTSKTDKKIQKLEEKLTRLRSKSHSDNKQASADNTGKATIKKAIVNLKASFGKQKSSSPEMKRIKDQHKEAMLQIKLEYYKKKLDAEQHTY